MMMEKLKGETEIIDCFWGMFEEKILLTLKDEYIYLTIYYSNGSSGRGKAEEIILMAFHETEEVNHLINILRYINYCNEGVIKKTLDPNDGCFKDILNLSSLHTMRRISELLNMGIEVYFRLTILERAKDTISKMKL